MFKVLLLLLFILILIAYVFSDPYICTATNSTNKDVIKSANTVTNNIPSHVENKLTLEEDIINNMKTGNNEMTSSPAYQPLLANGASGCNI